MVDTSAITLQLHPLNNETQVARLCSKIMAYGIFMLAGVEQHEGVFSIRVHTRDPDLLLPFLKNLPEVSEATAEPAAIPSLVTRIFLAVEPDFWEPSPR